MPAGSITITGAGDTGTVIRKVQQLPTSVSVTDAWFAIKTRASDPDSAALVLKHITSAAVTGVGQITDSGATSTQGVLQFSLTITDTAALAPNYPYTYAVKALLNTGDVQTVDAGIFTAGPEIIQAG